MKLNRKVTNIQFIITLTAAPFALLIMYFSFNFFLEREIDKKLMLDESKIANLIENGYLSYKISPFAGFRVVSDSIAISQSVKNEVILDPFLNKNREFRTLTTIKKINGIHYLIYVKQSLVERKHMVYVMVTVILIFIVFSAIIFQIFFWKMQNKIWQPFFNSIDKLKKISLGDETFPKFDPSDVDEFNMLNKELNFMTNKILSDYLSLKEYAENAAHETQTPLAIIRLEIEEIMQDDLPNRVRKRIYKVYQAANRVSLLTEKLLLLTKIDNLEFNKLEVVNVTDLMLKEIGELDLLIKQKNIAISVLVKQDFKHSMDLYLLSILVDNLLSNAIKHNFQNGKIEIVSERESIAIKNTTFENVEVTNVFKRFYKSSKTENSIGLGLSIVERIAEISKLHVKVESLGNTITFHIQKKIV
ncbi:hypothetical protein DNU06_04985 [Putridiphycobacter roseus]|uniref:histidine kinase n=1 Tax=Putridiphycobacter roseus TaxID=2219161 RepID=A0A2W1NJ44_9FLAO|nr:HAMP domain-containing sensor histidine kinase [Putridiphycobacter roseus]PZE17976.1 hypothetical protein DNU06_04985 [Putridiphycobacter roseus]